MPRVYCTWTECDHNKRGKCKARTISMEDHYHTPTCDNYEGEWLEPRPVLESEARRVSDKIMKAMLARMNEDLNGGGKTNDA